MSHDHLTFLKHGESSSSRDIAPSAFQQNVFGVTERQKTPSVMQAQIVEYLQRLTAIEKVFLDKKVLFIYILSNQLSLTYNI